MLEILKQLVGTGKKTYLLLPNHTWYIGTIQYVDKEVCMLSADINDNDGEYYQLYVRLERIYAVEVGVDPRSNTYTLDDPDFEETKPDAPS